MESRVIENQTSFGEDMQSIKHTFIRRFLVDLALTARQALKVV